MREKATRTTIRVLLEITGWSAIGLIAAAIGLDTVTSGYRNEENGMNLWQEVSQYSQRSDQPDFCIRKKLWRSKGHIIVDCYHLEQDDPQEDKIAASMLKCHYTPTALEMDIKGWRCASKNSLISRDVANEYYRMTTNKTASFG